MTLSRQDFKRIQDKIGNEERPKRKPTTIKRLFNVEEERRRDELQQRISKNIKRHSG